MPRIIAGYLKSRRILAPRDRGVRPTSDRVKEALFQILVPRLEGASVLDLYAGTGNLGLEALSRGAGSCCFVEREKSICALIKKNAAALDVRPAARVICGHSIAAIKRFWRGGTERFDVVLADPPYAKSGTGPSECRKLLRALDRYDIFAPGAILAAEHHKNDPPARDLKKLILSSERRYGDTVLSFYETI